MSFKHKASAMLMITYSLHGSCPEGKEMGVIIGTHELSTKREMRQSMECKRKKEGAGDTIVFFIAASN